MARSILDIIIRTFKQGGADKETVAGLVNIKKNLMEAGVIAGSFVAAYYAVDKVLDATVGTFVNYAAQVRETSRLTGTSAEDTSRLIQMADNLTISYESLQKALWFAQSPLAIGKRRLERSTVPADWGHAELDHRHGASCAGDAL